jgi:hypothetical protein
MKNTALCDLIATSENSCTSFRLVRTAISPGKCRVKKPEPGYGVAEVALCAEHHFMRASYVLFAPRTVTFVTDNGETNLRLRFPAPM